MRTALFPIGLRIPVEERPRSSAGGRWEQGRTRDALYDVDDEIDVDVESSTTEDESEGYWETYIVRAKTGNLRGAGTDANVTVQLFGESDDSGPIPLETSEHRHKFQKAQTDTFHLTCRCGPPRQLSPVVQPSLLHAACRVVHGAPLGASSGAGRSASWWRARSAMTPQASAPAGSLTRWSWTTSTRACDGTSHATAG